MCNTHSYRPVDPPKTAEELRIEKERKERAKRGEEMEFIKDTMR